MVRTRCGTSWCALRWSPPSGAHREGGAHWVEATRWNSLGVDFGAVHSVDDARPGHHSQAFECRIRDRARASRRAAALPMRFCRGRGRRAWAP